MFPQLINFKLAPSPSFNDMLSFKKIGTEVISKRTEPKEAGNSFNNRRDTALKNGCS